MVAETGGKEDIKYAFAIENTEQHNTMVKDECSAMNQKGPKLSDSNNKQPYMLEPKPSRRYFR